MKNISELARYIRFQLSQLGTENKHHEFEHLARQFARLRICENILPATGPVSAGGDQGHDFETYKSYLSATPIATSTFLGWTRGKKFVFACSLQGRKKIASKIKADVKTICVASHTIHGIYYFCEADLPVAKRHELSSWCQQTFNAELEIFDGTALAEQLTNLDIFWIAEQYLQVPSELFPRSTTADSTYESYKERWLTGDPKPYSFGDFFQVKYGLRRATFQAEMKADLSKWIRQMGAYLVPESPLRQRATYEICVASLRGLNNLTEKKYLVQEFFCDIETMDEVSELRDAVTLLSYCSTAQLLGHFQIDAEQLHEWSKSLIGTIDKAISGARAPGIRCELFQIRGQSSHLPFKKSSTPKMDFDEGFVWWSRLLREVSKAPLFPLEDFADVLTVMTEVVGNDERFLRVTQKTDELLSKRSSGYIAAEKCRDRAMAYYKSGCFLQSIKQLHQAKIKWFSAETLRGSLLAMLVLSDCYQRLGLIYPAKYYAAGVVFIAHHHEHEAVKDLFPRALFMLAESCYKGGEWLTFAQVARLALVAHSMYDENPFEMQVHQSLKVLYAHAAVARTLLNRFDMKLAEGFDQVFSKWAIDPEARAAIESLSGESSFWRTAPIEEIWAIVQADLTDRPFSDVGQQRSIGWKALGISWTVECDNDQVSSSIAEELVSTLQIILADIAARDLLLLPTRVRISVLITEGLRLNVEEIPDNAIATWRVGFPRSWIRNPDTFNDLRVAVLSLAITLLRKCSALNSQSFTREVKRGFSEGLTAKTFSVRPHADLYTELWSELEFNSPKRRELRPLFTSFVFNGAEHRLLAWVDIDGPGYSKERAKEFLGNRYEKAIRPIKLTLPRLLLDAQFKEQVRELNLAGLLDWEILLIVANICTDYRRERAVSQGAPLTEHHRALTELMFRDEEVSDPEIPLSIFTKERLDFQKKAFLAAVAKTWGLELHQDTPDFEALERLLDVRYHNSEDDIPHQQG
jgi:hypothetical protein